MFHTPCPLLDRLCPTALHMLLDLFLAAGETAYPVGGCVRDALLGRPPHDWDLAVTCLPQKMLDLCAEAGLTTIPTGMAHGTITVLLPTDGGRMPVECTTCRTEQGYSDGRHPDCVTFSGRLEDDLSRRDFTINAMAALREEDGHFVILDPFGGQQDLSRRIIRCVGDPEKRLREDALRVLRGVRFALRLEAEPEPLTRAALTHCADGLDRISGERIREELRGILLSPAPDRGVRMLRDLELLPHILPQIGPEAIALAERGGYAALSGLTANGATDPFCSRMAALLWGLEDWQIRAGLSRLKLSREEETRICARLSLRQGLPPPDMPGPEAARRLRAALSEEALPALELARAYASPAVADRSDRLAVQVQASETAREPVRMAELAIGGRELTVLGIPPGRDMGRILHDLLEIVLKDPVRNTPDALCAEARRLMR